MKKQTGWLLGIAFVCAEAPAHAQEGAFHFGQAGQFAVSAERMFGVTHSKQTTKPSNGTERTEDSTEISFLSTQLGSLAAVYTTPRVGLDYFAIDGLTLGAAFGVFTVSQSASSAGQTVDGPTIDGVLIAPRIGYAYLFSEAVGIWPRGGITYVGFGTKDNGPTPDESGVHLLALTLEVPLVIAPAPHVGFLIAPVLDFGVSGSQKRTDGTTGITTSTDITATEMGLEAGMFVYF